MARHGDGSVERRRVLSRDLMRDAHSSSRFAVDGNIVCVAAKRGYVAADPLQRNLLVAKTKVPNALVPITGQIIFDGFRGKKSSQSHSVIEVDGDDGRVTRQSVGDEVDAVKNTHIRGAVQKGTAVDVHHDGNLDAWVYRRRGDVHDEAVQFVLSWLLVMRGEAYRNKRVQTGARVVLWRLRASASATGESV